MKHRLIGPTSLKASSSWFSSGRWTQLAKNTSANSFFLYFFRRFLGKQTEKESGKWIYLRVGEGVGQVADKDGGRRETGLGFVVNVATISGFLLLRHSCFAAEKLRQMNKMILKPQTERTTEGFLLLEACSSYLGLLGPRWWKFVVSAKEKHAQRAGRFC